jgi:hypothetical protein
MPQQLVTFQVQLGPARWDAVSYVRGLSGDVSTPYLIPNETYASLAEDVAEDISRFLPLDLWVGSLNLGTSPLVTVANQQVYVCNPANGFTSPPVRIAEFAYGARFDLGAGNELTYLALLPSAPFNRWLFTPYILDNPSDRVLRDLSLAELSKYTQGAYAVDRDPATGLLSVAIYPIPSSAGIPLFAHYQANHVGVPDALGNAVYATIPDANKRHFARLLYALVLESEMQRAAKATSTSAGILRGTADPKSLSAMIERIRSETYQQLGAAVAVAIHTF